MGGAREEAVHDNLIVAAGYHPTELAATTVALASKVALGGKGSLGAAGLAAQIDIQYLQAVVVQNDKGLDGWPFLPLYLTLHPPGITKRGLDMSQYQLV